MTYEKGVIRLKDRVREDTLSAGVCSHCFSMRQFTDPTHRLVKCHLCDIVEPFTQTAEPVLQKSEKKSTDFNKDDEIIPGMCLKCFHMCEFADGSRQKVRCFFCDPLVPTAPSAERSADRSSAFSTPKPNKLPTSPIPSSRTNSNSKNNGVTAKPAIHLKDHTTPDDSAGLCSHCFSQLHFADPAHKTVRCLVCNTLELVPEEKGCAREAGGKGEVEKVKVEIVCMIQGFKNFELSVPKTGNVGLIRGKIAKHVKRDPQAVVLMGIHDEGEYSDDKMSLTDISQQYGVYTVYVMEKADVK